jgi:hypothetical protein
MFYNRVLDSKALIYHWKQELGVMLVKITNYSKIFWFIH